MIGRLNSKSIIIQCILFYLLLNCMLLSGCIASKIEKIITVSLLPHKYFVEKLVDSSWTVQSLIEPGFDPHSYDPGMKTALLLAKSRLYICNGNFIFEQELIKNLKKNSPKTLIVDTSTGITLIMGMHETDEYGSDAEYIDEEDLNQENEDNYVGTYDADITEEGVDPHYWMSPPEMIHQINEIKKALISIDPDQSSLYESRFKKIKQDIINFDNEIKKKIRKSGIRSFMIYHPVLSYFARNYNLNQISFEIEGKSPSPKQILYIISLAQQENIKTFFVQQGFDMASSMTIAKEINGKVIEIAPLAYDWFKSMKFISESLVAK